MKLSKKYPLGKPGERIARLVHENEDLREALRPFAQIALVRDNEPEAEDMIDAPDLCITPTMIRRAREAIKRR